MTIDANVDTTTPTEPLDTGHVEDAPIVGVSRLKKSKRASSRNVPKRGSLVDGDTSSPTKLSIYNDSSDNVVESTDVPLEQTDGANDVPNDVTVPSVPLDELFDYDDVSVQTMTSRPNHHHTRRDGCLTISRWFPLVNRQNDENLTWET
jgi:hypothetical protein